MKLRNRGPSIGNAPAASTAAFARGVCLLALAAGASAADAQCGAVIEALERARLQPRVAQVLVDGTGHPSGTDPVSLRIDGVIYEDFDGIGYATRQAETHDETAAALRRAEQDGRADCAAEGPEVFAGREVLRYHFVLPAIAGHFNPVVLLVERSSGLPLYHSYANIGTRGFVWVYGAAVREPVERALARS